MKVMINIPEKIEEYIKDYIPIGAGDNVFCYPDEIVRMIQNGTPIPDNAIVCDIEQIRAEIEKPLLVERYADTESAKAQAIALSWCLEIIDKYTK